MQTSFLATEASRPSLIIIGCKVAILTVAWWIAAIVVSLWMKRVIGSVNGEPPLFKHPYLFTAVLNIGVGVWSLLGSLVSRVASRTARSHSMTRLRWHEIMFLVSIGGMQGVEYCLSNTSYEFLSVATNRMVMACTVVLQLLTAILWRLEAITCLKWVAAAMLATGAFVDNLDCQPKSPAIVKFLCGTHPRSSDSQTADSVIGWVLVVSSVLVSANRWALTQHIFQRSHPDSAFKKQTKFQMMPYISIGNISICFLLSAIFDSSAYSDILKSRVAEGIALPAVVVSFCIATLTACELLIVSITAATVMVILAVVHNIPIMIAGIVLYHDQIFQNQWIGFSICSVGAVMYFYARTLDKDRDENARCTNEMSMQQAGEE